MPVSRDGASEMKCGKDALHVNRVHGNGKPVKGKEKKKERHSSKSHAPANNHTPSLPFRIRAQRKERYVRIQAKQVKT